MSLQVGDTAPDFTLYGFTAEGLKPVTLSQYRGRNVVLLFFPLAFTGVCTREMCTMSQGLDHYATLDADVLGISVDSPHAQAAWAKQNDISVTLLSDFNKKVSTAYGSIHTDDFKAGGVFLMEGVSKRSAFVVDKDGMIVYARVFDNPSQMPDFEAVKTALHQTLAV